MPTLPPKFNWGSEIKNVNPTLYNQLNDSYSAIARVLNTKITKYITTVDPISSASINANFDQGDIWVNASSDKAWILTSRTTNTDVTWKQIT